MRAQILLAAGMGEKAQCGGPRPMGGDAYTTRASIYSRIPELSQTRLVPKNWYYLEIRADR